MYIYQKMYHTEIAVKLLQGVCWTTYVYDLRLKRVHKHNKWTYLFELQDYLWFKSTYICRTAYKYTTYQWVILYDLLYPEKPVEAEIKRNLFNWTFIIPPYILMLCYGGGFDHWLIHLVNFSWRVKFSLSNETRCA